MLGTGAVRRVPGRQLLHSDYAELAGAVLHDRALAIRHWKLALALDPNVSDYGKQLAGYLTDSGRNEEAAEVITTIIELRPSLQSDPQLNRWLQKARAAMNSPAAGPSSESP